jgi:hypothetical protein
VRGPRLPPRMRVAVITASAARVCVAWARIARSAPRAPRAVCPSVARTGGPMPRQRRAVACGTGQRAVNATGLGWHWAALAGTAGSLWSPSRPSRSSRYRTASVSATARVLTWGTRSTHMGTRSTHMGTRTAGCCTR